MAVASGRRRRSGRKPARSWQANTALFLLCGACALGGRAWLLQPPRWPEPGPEAARMVGSYHVHSDLSHDSQISKTRWAAAAQGRALDFVVLTDHDTQAHRPSLDHNVLILPQAELSTPAGHLVGLGLQLVPLPQARRDPALPLQLRQQGALGIAAHPASPKRPWTGGPQGLGGCEPANFSAQFDRRVRGWQNLLTLPVLALWPANPAAVLWQLYRRDDAAVALWDQLPAPGLGICGGDGHGWIPLGLNLSAWHVVLDKVARPQRPSLDQAGQVLAELMAGHFHSVAGLWQREVGFSFAAQQAGTQVAQEGDVVGHADALEARLAKAGACTVVSGPAAPGLLAAEAEDRPWQRRLVLLRNGEVVARSSSGCLRFLRPTPGSYRVEAWAPLPGLVWGSAWAPVLYSNRITVTEAF